MKVDIHTHILTLDLPSWHMHSNASGWDPVGPTATLTIDLLQYC